MACNAVLKTTETSLRLLDDEAKRVARGMASFRNERVDRLCGSSSPLWSSNHFEGLSGAITNKWKHRILSFLLLPFSLRQCLSVGGG